MDPLKEAFNKIKEDIISLKSEISQLKEQISSLKESNNPTQTPTQPLQQTNQQFDSSNNPTQTPTHNSPLEPLKTQNIPFSTRNRGVPTNRQTDKQTNQQTDNSSYNQENTPKTDFEKAHEILNSLDSVKKSIRLKFKQLTPQEMLVFSTLYELEDQNLDEITYKLIAKRLNLSESSIRDYTNRLINKGVPIIKTRQNNKKIVLSISENLRKIANLSTIIQLREI